jgi:hypothetical protein
MLSKRPTSVCAQSKVHKTAKSFEPTKSSNMQQPKTKKLPTHSAVTCFENLKATRRIAENVLSDKATFHSPGHFNLLKPTGYLMHQQV